MDANFKSALRARSGETSVVAQSVLVAGFEGDPLIGGLDGIAATFAEDIAAGGGGVAWQDVSAAKTGNASALGGAIDGDGSRVDANAIDRNFFGEQHAHDVAITGTASLFMTVADDEENFAAILGAGGEIKRSLEDRVVHHTRGLFHGLHVRRAFDGGLAVNGRA